MEVIILLAGMKNVAQHQRLLLDKEKRDALEKHIAFVEEVDNMTQDFQIPSPAPAISSGEGASPSPRFVNRPDLAAPSCLRNQITNRL